MIAARYTGRGVLLAVGALVAGPTVAHVATPAPARIVVVVVPQPTPVVIEMARPRVMPTGAPACGNVTARALPHDLDGGCR
ncbi:MAG: hypothetical protein JNL83_20130 [Myxococcales bacterium]|nr:hypothetical protein [Myxococcales bacterium]